MDTPTSDEKRERSKKDQKAADQPEAEGLMSVDEFGATNPVNRTLFAGFVHYCKASKVPPRLTAKEWKRALTNWHDAPVTT